MDLAPILAAMMWLNNIHFPVAPSALEVADELNISNLRQYVMG